MSANQPVAPPPTRPRRTPAAEPAPSTEVAHAEPAAADPVETLGRSLFGEQAGQQRSSHAAFMGLGRPVDPEKDLMPTAPRLPRYIVAAVTLIRSATGRSQQQIIADAITGRTPILPAVLDEAFMEIYGYPRPPVS